MTKDAINPEVDKPVAKKDPHALLQEFLKANNLQLTVLPGRGVKVVSDGSIIIDPPTVDITYGR